jgi:preprotein translocase subunit SecD
MAVDANILIFERMKEELRLGRTLGAAIEAGFNRAWDSIRDSNFSTLITCAILYYFGSGLIRGFALTLALGVVVSMFTAIVVTRTFLRVLLSTGVARMPALFGVGGVAVPVEPAKRATSRPDPNGFLPAAN